MEHGDEYLVIKRKYLPTELICYTKPYKLMTFHNPHRRLHQHELPLNYRLCKDLNDFFYKKYMGYVIDIKYLQFSIRVWKDKLAQSKRHVSNPFSLPYWREPHMKSDSIHSTIMLKRQEIENLTVLMKHYFPMYYQSTYQLEQFNIVELE